jgi:hypothetical protein
MKETGTYILYWSELVSKLPQCIAGYSRKGVIDFSYADNVLTVYYPYDIERIPTSKVLTISMQKEFEKE